MGCVRCMRASSAGLGRFRRRWSFAMRRGKDLSAQAGEVKGSSMEDAIGTVERDVGLKGLPPPDAVGYRVVHPGPNLRGHQRLTPEVLAELHKTVAYAPLHNPEALEVIDEMMRRFPEVPHFACFDTVFHETMPEEATVYPLPAEVRAQGVRRYGFHGLSCESIVAQLREAAGICVSAADGDCAPGQRVQRDRVRRWQVGGHDHGADADGRRGDGDAAGRHRSGAGDLPDAAGGRDGGFGGGHAEPALGNEGAGRGERYARTAQARGGGGCAGAAGDPDLCRTAW